MLKYNIEHISKQFQILGDYVSCHPVGSGHINDTLATTFSQSGAPVRYIIQRINHQVFQNPLALMDNVSRVTRHIRRKLVEEGHQDVSRRVMTLIPTREGNQFYRDEASNYWRAYLYIENAHTFNKLESDSHAYEAAKAFGLFQKMLTDMPKPPLYETIPNFHDGQHRFGLFTKALERDKFNRAVLAETEINYIQNNKWLFDVLPRLVEQGEVPMRITHNDTKINNVMLDNTSGEGICPIDLDTVMPGLSLYDFGDMARTSISPTDEDEQDLSKIRVVRSRFEAIVRGYLSAAGSFLTPAECDHLVHGAKLITSIIGLRFLTDYLAGDVYFKIHRPDHNLERCRAQFRLVQEIERNEEDLTGLVSSVLAEQAEQDAEEVTAS